MLSSYSLYNINIETKNGEIVFKPLYAFSLKSEKNPFQQTVIGSNCRKRFDCTDRLNILLTVIESYTHSVKIGIVFKNTK